MSVCQTCKKPKEYINLENMTDKDKTVLSVVTGIHIGDL